MVTEREGEGGRRTEWEGQRQIEDGGDVPPAAVVQIPHAGPAIDCGVPCRRDAIVCLHRDVRGRVTGHVTGQPRSGHWPVGS